MPNCAFMYVTSMLSLLKPSACEPTKRSCCGALPSAAAGPSRQPTTCTYESASLHCTSAYIAMQESRGLAVLRSAPMEKLPLVCPRLHSQLSHCQHPDRAR